VNIQDTSMPYFVNYVILVLLVVNLLAYFRRLPITSSSSSSKLPLSIKSSSSTGYATLITTNDTLAHNSVKNSERNLKSAERHHAHALIQKYILAGSLILNTSDHVYDKLFYDGNLYPMHQYRQSHNVSARCNEHALKAPSFPATPTDVMNDGER